MLTSLGQTLFTLVSGPLALAMMPILILLAYMVGGTRASLAAAALTPLLLVLAARLDRHRAQDDRRRVHGPAGMTGTTLEAVMQTALGKANHRGAVTACIIVEMSGFTARSDAVEKGKAKDVQGTMERAIRSGLRRRDRVFDLGPGKFGCAIAPANDLTPAAARRIVNRLRDRLVTAATALGQGVKDDGAGLQIRFGICMSTGRADETGRELVRNARASLANGRPGDSSGIRFFVQEKTAPPARPMRLRDDVRRALQAGEIRAWFQPQLCTHTGQVSGFEALARWQHPKRGLIAPAKFLPYFERAELAGQLRTLMLRDALGALKVWEARGFTVPSVGVNFSPDDLRDANLADKVLFEIDRQELAPQRLCVEILETVFSNAPDEVTARNIRRLAQAGCRIDLDDFGTGHASISSLKNFAVQRLKIDRSYVRQIDCDQNRQRMVSAILTMAEQLDLDSLAEGVETAGEHTLLAQLGCNHVQGFGIARPMAMDRTLPWLRQHMSKLPAPPRIGKSIQ